MTKDQVKIGVRVRTLREFSCVPRGTEGIIDQLYRLGNDPSGDGFMVAWSLPDRPLPPNYCEYDGRPQFQSGILRDGFNLDDELIYLEVVEPPKQSVLQPFQAVDPDIILKAITEITRKHAIAVEALTEKQLAEAIRQAIASGDFQKNVLAYPKANEHTQSVVYIPYRELETAKSKVFDALEIAMKYGGIDGDHHKAWVIDQMVRILTGAGYERFVKDAKAGEDGPNTYDWDEGIAP